MSDVKTRVHHYACEWTVNAWPCNCAVRDTPLWTREHEQRAIRNRDGDPDVGDPNLSTEAGMVLEALATDTVQSVLALATGLRVGDVSDAVDELAETISDAFTDHEAERDAAIARSTGDSR